MSMIRFCPLLTTGTTSELVRLFGSPRAAGFLPERTTQKQARPKSKGDNKASDFLSRLTMVPQNLASEGVGKLREVESVYVGVSLLQAIFPDVQRISETVLEIFKRLAWYEPRELRHFVESFQHIRFSEVRFSNVPRTRLIELLNGIAKAGARSRMVGARTMKRVEEWQARDQNPVWVELEG